jgi:hypothetical protein
MAGMRRECQRREGIEGIVRHPEGVLVRFGQKIEKITPNAKQRGDGRLLFAYSLARRHDVQPAAVGGDRAWLDE